jgi:D-alanine-D-alanine ligase
MPADAIQIATHKVKWDLEYQTRHKIELGAAKDLSEQMQKKIVTTTKRICRALGVDGYCRVDFRLTDAGELYFLEANPNPDIAYTEAFPSAAEKAGMSYHDLLQRIVTMGIRRAKI